MSRSLLRGVLLAGCMLATHIALAADVAGDPRDIAGVWLPDGRTSGRTPRTADQPFTPEAKAAVARYAAEYLPVDPTLDDGTVGCLEHPLPSTMIGAAQYPKEWLITPSQITVFSEIYGSIRRIHLDGRRAPDGLLPSDMGFSVGHWEGDTLVIATSHLRVEGAGPFSGNPPSSMQRHLVERVKLGKDAQGNKRLENEITIHDPGVWTKPVVVQMYYKWAPDVEVGEYLCQQDVWDQNVQGNPSSVPWRH